MSFQYTLANLLANNERAVAVLFLDETGEAVDVACSEYSPYEMKVVGAYVGIYLRQLRQLLERSKLGQPDFLHIENESIHLYASSLPDGYYLVLVQRRPAVVAQARETLQRARDEIAREIFAEV